MLPHHHDRALVALALAVGAFASYTALDLGGRAAAAAGRVRRAWLAAGAMALGGGIWSTHFIGMLAFGVGVPVGYAPLPVALSAAVAVSASALVLRAVVPAPGGAAYAASVPAGALLMAATIGATHYVGMAAVRTPATVRYDLPVVALSLAVGAALAATALWLARRRGPAVRLTRRAAGANAALTALAIAATHYVGLAGTHFTAPAALSAPPAGSITPSAALAAAVTAATLVLLALALGAAVVDRWLDAVRAEGEATRRADAVARSSEARFGSVVGSLAEGIVITDRDDVIEYVNPRMEQITGYAAAELVGRVAHEVLVPADERERFRGRMAVRLRGASDRYEMPHVRKDGSRLWVEIGGAPLRDAGGAIVGTVGTVWDVTARRELEEQMRHEARHDPLTALANRTHFAERLARALAAPRGDGGVAVLFLDLDDFKVVNDSLGHAAGDQLLIEVAARLLNATRGCDAVARLGGDEFAVLLNNVRSDRESATVAERILAALRRPVALEGREVRAGASIGIAHPAAGDGAEELLRNADAAMYRAKHRGKNGYELFAPAMHAEVLARLELEADLRQAVDGLGREGAGEFHLAYQPVVDARTGCVAGFEALLRWTHPRRGVVSPAEFIPCAEATGLVATLGRWVLREACRQRAAWERLAGRAPGGPPLSVAVNVSTRQLESAAVVDDVTAALAGAGLAPSALTLEITETAMMHAGEATLDRLHALKALGVRLAIDDFGTGYSSLAYLHRLPVDVLKIDRAFVRGLGYGTRDEVLVRAILAIAGELGLTCVAEGVETAAQRDCLRDLGCDSLQGYLFAKPLPPDRAAALLAGAAPGAPGASARRAVALHE